MLIVNTILVGTNCNCEMKNLNINLLKSLLNRLGMIHSGKTRTIIIMFYIYIIYFWNLTCATTDY